MTFKGFDEMPLVITVPELMHFLNIGRNTAYNLIKHENICCIRIGKQIRIPKDELRRFLTHNSNS